MLACTLFSAYFGLGFYTQTLERVSIPCVLEVSPAIG
jgi:hypothetical protein